MLLTPGITFAELCTDDPLVQSWGLIKLDKLLLELLQPLAFLIWATTLPT